MPDFNCTCSCFGVGCHSLTLSRTQDPADTSLWQSAYERQSRKPGSLVKMRSVIMGPRLRLLLTAQAAKPEAVKDPIAPDVSCLL